MKRFFILLLLCGSLVGVSGCALLSSALPSSVDANGAIVPGTHAATATQQAAAGLLPYGLGSVLLNGVLLVLNGVERYKANKVSSGLSSTIIAINKIKNDPELTTEWEKLKEILKNEHTIDGVQSIIQKFIAKA